MKNAQIDAGEVLAQISPKRLYRLAEAARLATVFMPAYLFHSLLKTKFKAEGNHKSGACRDLTGRELLEVIQCAKDPSSIKVFVNDGRSRTQRTYQQSSRKAADQNAWTCWSEDSSEPADMHTETANTHEECVVPRWVRRVWDLTYGERQCSPSLLDQLGRFSKVFAELPDGKWYVKRGDFVAASVKPLQGVQYIWELLLRRSTPVETAELIGVWTDSVMADDEITPYTEFGKSGWGITRLFDEEKEYDRVCKNFDRAIEAIGKACPELGRYFQLTIQRPSLNGEGWIFSDHDPGEWVLHVEKHGSSDAAMHKVGDSWNLRLSDHKCSVPNQRLGLEYLARILAERETGVPCSLLRHPAMADALATCPNVQSILPIFHKHLRRQDFLPSKTRIGLVQITEVVDRKRAEASLEGRVEDSMELSLGSTRLRAIIEFLRNRPRLLAQLDEMNVEERSQVKKNLDSAIDFLNLNGAKEIADHLAQVIECGEVCRYAGPLTWEVRGLSPFPCVSRLAWERVYGVQFPIL